MSLSNKKRLAILLFPLMLSIAACFNPGEIEATERVQAGGIDQDFLNNNSTATVEAIEEDRVFQAEIDATEAAESSDDEEQQVRRRAGSSISSRSEIPTATSSPPTPIPTATSARPTAIPTVTPIVAATSVLTATSVPTVTPVPAPTLAPVPTPTEKPTVASPWITALKAVEIASKAQKGVVKNVNGHVAYGVGQNDAGDISNTTSSPGAGYSSS